MAKTSHTAILTPAQVAQLREVLEEDGYDFEVKPYTLFAASKGKLNIAVYEKGPKVLVQGKDTEDFIRFTLEPRILGAVTLGYEEIVNPEMFTPHLGIDESGKGDFFGPLVIAGVYTDAGVARHLMDAGIRDSKAIKSDGRIRDLAGVIRETPGVAWEVLAIGPERYNALYERFANLNRLLAWGHAKVIELLLERCPDCPRALSDQFANPRELQRALQERGRGIVLEQRVRAESDVAVAAASILARERFIDWLRDKGRELGMTVPRGASQAVQDLTLRLRKERGDAFLREVAKTHFAFAKASLPEE